MSQELPFWILTMMMGLCAGSFINLVASRLPNLLNENWQQQSAEILGLSRKKIRVPSLWKPRSYCIHCKHHLHSYDLIPILSYLLLGGRCRSCRHQIGKRTLLVESLVVVATLACFYLGGGMTLTALMAMLLCWLLILLAVIDLETYLLPDCITLPSIWLGLLGNLYGALIPIEDAVIGAVLGYVSLYAVGKVYYWSRQRVGMGNGDFKLFAMLGAWLGWQCLSWIILVASLLALLMVLLQSSKTRVLQQSIAFGPFLAIAGVIMLFVHLTRAQVFLL